MPDHQRRHHDLMWKMPCRPPGTRHAGMSRMQNDQPWTACSLPQMRSRTPEVTQRSEIIIHPFRSLRRCQGQRPLKGCPGDDLRQEVVAPARGFTVGGLGVFRRLRRFAISELHESSSEDPPEPRIGMENAIKVLSLLSEENSDSTLMAFPPRMMFGRYDLACKRRVNSAAPVGRIVRG